MQLTLEENKANNTQTYTMTNKRRQSIDTYKYTNYIHYYKLT